MNAQKRTGGDSFDVKWLWLILPAGVSSAGWVLQFALVQRATGSALEGAYYLAGLVGAIAFLFTAPVFTVVASLIEARFSAWSFAAALFMVSLPALSFEVLADSSSFLSLFFGGGPWRESDSLRLALSGSAVALTWFAISTAILFALLKRGRAATIVGAALLAILSFGGVLVRFLHS